MKQTITAGVCLVKIVTNSVKLLTVSRVSRNLTQVRVVIRHNNITQVKVISTA